MLKKDVIWLGPAPGEEDCAQVGDPAYRERALSECRQFIQAIKLKCGEPPDGATLKVKAAPHAFGACYEVVVEFDPTIDDAVRWANSADANAPTRWCDVGMTAPTMNQGRTR
jgi:hypothetical protein